MVFSIPKKESFLMANFHAGTSCELVNILVTRTLLENMHFDENMR
jgi:hypothetical protein